MLTALLAAGADVNLKSEWENGPYTVLDNTDERTARFLLSHGATLTPNVAARLGWFEALQSLVAADGALVHARGGDGQQPLHEAKTVTIADFLLDHGADIDVRCIDHKSTPAQYALVDRPEVCRRLLERGATPDIFMAARLGRRRARHSSGRRRARLPRRSHQRARLRAGAAPAHLLLDDRLRPVAARRRLKFGHRDVYTLLIARSPARIQLLNALLAGNERAAERLARRRSVAPLVASPRRSTVTSPRPSSTSTSRRPS